MTLVAVVVVIAFVLAVSGNAFGDSAEVNESGVTVYRSDGSLTGATITEEEGTWPGSDRIWEICAAIARAEGFNRGAGYVPYDLNNPGDISDGAKTYGSQPHSGSNVTTFPTAEIGWQWLYDKIERMVTGKSSTYPANTPWSGIAVTWAGNSAPWLANVIDYLGVSSDSTPADYVNGVSA